LTTVSAPSNAAETLETEELESIKPFAPVSALLPATRARLWIEGAHNVSLQLASKNLDKAERSKLLTQLNEILTHRPKLFLKGEKPLQRVGSTALAQFTASKSSPSSVTTTTNNQRDPFAPSPSISEQFSTALNRADVARQWGILQAQESKTESQNEVRAAWNYYTQQLEFNPTSYEFTGSPEEKKRRIRNDQLPTPQSVIVSDLDLRDLYRNQLLTALDDVTAEVGYQLKQPIDDIDLSDALELMNQAHEACKRWFDMIDTRDVDEAEKIVRNGQQ
jgi:Asp-tRNA(Asn)/Glu-tRNA(Gln) amidotransferase C subunit